VKKSIKLLLAIIVPVLSLVAGSLFFGVYSYKKAKDALALGSEQIYVGSGATFVVSGGLIVGDPDSIYVDNDGILEIRGGQITGDIHNHGVVKYYGGKFNGVLNLATGKVLELYAEYVDNIAINIENISIGTEVVRIADDSLLSDFDIGVLNIINLPENAELRVEGNSVVIANKGVPVTVYVDGTSQGTFTLPLDQNMEYAAANVLPKKDNECCGYFLDADLTKDAYHYATVQDIVNEKGTFSLYTRTAMPQLLNRDQLLKGIVKVANTSVSGIVVVPRMFGTIKVQTLYSTGSTGGAFYNCTNMTACYLPSSITEIAAGSFNPGSGESSLEMVNLCDTLTSINESAFSGCIRLTGSLTIPNAVTKIGNFAFSGCSGFTGSLTIPNAVTNIGSYAFQNCTGFTGSLTIGNSVTSIGSYSFRDCSGFNGSLTIGNSVTSIGTSAFQKCSGFTGSLTIPNSVTSIGNLAFQNCSGFNGNLTFGNGIKSIGSYAFRYCSGFTGSLQIPNSVTSIGSYAFGGCSGFNGSISLGNGITSIGNNAFSGCKSLTGSLMIPNSVTSIGSFAFSGCGGFTGHLSIGDNVKDIGASAFRSCSGFTGSLTIPNAVTSIGSNAFFGCKGFNGSLTIGNSVTSIGDSAFSGCSGLSGSVTLNNNLQSIGSSAFRGCVGLTSIYIPNSVTTITASSYSSSPFNGCSSSLKIYCGAASKPSGWGTYWNYYSTSSTLATYWNYTRAQYEDAISVTLTINAHYSDLGSSSETVTLKILNGDTVYFYNYGDYVAIETASGRTYYELNAYGSEQFLYGLVNGVTYEGDQIDGLEFVMNSNLSITLEFTCFDINTDILVWDDRKKRLVRKKAKDIRYIDKLLVWNFDKGCLDFAKPLFIQKHEIAHNYVEIKFSDGTILNIAKEHAVFNVDQNRFRPIVSNDREKGCPVGTRVIKDNGDIVTIVSKRRIHKPLEYTNIISDFHMNIYTNGILTSTPLNNKWKIENMKFVLNEEKCEDLSLLEGVEEKWIKGLRLDTMPDGVIRHITSHNPGIETMADFVNEKKGSMK